MPGLNVRKKDRPVGERRLHSQVCCCGSLGRWRRSLCVVRDYSVWEQSPTCDVLAHVATADRSTRLDGGTNAALAMAMMKAIGP